MRRRLLVLGGDGMLGHQLLASLRPRHEVRVTVRLPRSHYASFGLFDENNCFDCVAATDLERLAEVLDCFRPDYVVNAIGIVKQRAESKQPIVSLEVNALLPHRLALLASLAGARLIQFSTDCVFSGRRGHYTEDDLPDPEDLYGRTKLLGEPTGPTCLTLRTSIVGRELQRKSGLVEWFLAQRGGVRGFRGAIYTGFTTLEIARIVEMLVTRHPQTEGLWHVSSDRISKYDLLLLLKKHYGLQTEVTPDDDFSCDRSLDSSRFRSHFAYRPPSWEQMISELAGKESAPA